MDKEFVVKVTYRKGRRRGVIAMPAGILQAWFYPDYVQIVPDGEGGAILRAYRPDSDMVNNESEDVEV